MFVGEHDLQGAIATFFFGRLCLVAFRDEATPRTQPKHPAVSLFVGRCRVLHTYFINESRIITDGCLELNEGLHSEGAWYRGAE